MGGVWLQALNGAVEMTLGRWRPGVIAMWYVLGAFGVYLAMVGVLLAAAPWWVALGVVLCLLAGTLAAAPELGRSLAIGAACATRSES